MTKTCEWFALCTREAVGTAPHPVLGDVPVCMPCANNMGLVVEPFETSDFDRLLDTHEAELDAAVNSWPNIERNVAVTPALRRRFVNRNFAFAFNRHVVYSLGEALYAVTGAGDDCTITARVTNASNQDVQDLIALLSEWEG